MSQGTCASCRCNLADGDTTGVSGLYSPDYSYLLCEFCWLLEEELVEESGKNDHPEIVATYQRNQPGGHYQR